MTGQLEMLSTSTYLPSGAGEAVWIGSFGTIYKVPSEPPVEQWRSWSTCSAPSSSAPLLQREGPPDLAAVAALAGRYGLEFDFASTPALLARTGSG